MRQVSIIIIHFCLVSSLTGCASESSLLLERWSKKRIVPTVAEEEEPTEFSLAPESLTVTRKGIKITTSYFSQEDLSKFFSKKGPLKSRRIINPYVSDFIVFHIKIFNRSGGTIRIKPEESVLLDNFNRQYEFLTPEYVVDLCSSRSTAYSLAKTTGDAAPGIYGAPARVASTLAAVPFRRRYAVLKQVTLHGGAVHDRIIYDGFVAFLRPKGKVGKLTLLLPNIQTEEDQDLLDFEFPFTCQSD